ncbi:phage tail protein [Providencia huashanensis]|uniref:phage tail protein n=1 Tax=Providencia huashanensis TaxID=3037798 RepID=UPI00404579E8
MLKPNLLRQTIIEQIPQFKQNPDLLEVYITEGGIQATGTQSASYLNEYQIQVLAMDYAGELSALSLAILTFARKHQPDLLFNPDKRANGIRYKADILDNEKIDVLYTIKATERVIVKKVNGKIVQEHISEPEIALPAWDIVIDEGVMVHE